MKTTAEFEPTAMSQTSLLWLSKSPAIQTPMFVDYLRQLAQAAGAANPEQLAEELALLKEGAIVTAQVRNMPTLHCAQRIWRVYSSTRLVVWTPVPVVGNRHETAR
ncbi:hypothetical protein J2W42_005127 [Rhizobium tibeticum]|uniref:hypothetical protein n=1 Tax=Rhizobium tibeticum TaxID=501024 RepID=UPI0027846B51|nr:hypothetical protein [Rhizobium tibeticum]MDP9812257.1 hypothetical protein [Rhizobium tibeticum]